MIFIPNQFLVTCKCNLLLTFSPKHVAVPCGQWQDCTGLVDKHYSDVRNSCKSYYTCQNEIFSGHYICTKALADECYGKSDGTYDIGCRSYVVCNGGTGTVVNCPDPPAANTVFNNVTKTCDDPKHVAPPCGQWRDCTAHVDKRYPDVWNGCKSYYTCQNEYFYGHNICTPGLIFDDSLQTCNWPNNVPPPCGSAKTASG
ncbi:hypothetical protein FSP39_019952 [Pinctada imbricata]|uniref:Chitin-binding type-2 domain-containing protein n=1 Tax=Pinctada imbricata TaxID=66713 RepID=A0AA88XX70_PINIB|nr:hypothetical protein FSP39_019952 [Pinctada imbricata]